MSFVYNNASRALLSGEIDLGGDDIRAILVMTNTTVDTERDATLIDDFTTLDEFDGSGYARVALTSEAVTQNDVDNSGDFDADDLDFGTLGAGARQCQGMILYLHVTDDTDSIPLFYIDSGGFPFTNGDVTITWAAAGIARLATA